MRPALLLAAGALVLLSAGWATPQATTNEIYVLAAVPGQVAYKLQTVRIDAPLTLTADAAGVLHLAVGPANRVRGEIPAATATGWSLAHAPAAGASCYRNGIHQTAGLDYVAAAAAITSPFWRAGDTLACDYEW